MLGTVTRVLVAFAAMGAVSGASAALPDGSVRLCVVGEDGCLGDVVSATPDGASFFEIDGIPGTGCSYVTPDPWGGFRFEMTSCDKPHQYQFFDAIPFDGEVDTDAEAKSASDAVCRDHLEGQTIPAVLEQAGARDEDELITGGWVFFRTEPWEVQCFIYLLGEPLFLGDFESQG